MDDSEELEPLIAKVMDAIDDARVDPNYAVGNATFNEGVEAARQAVRAALAPASEEGA